jgi:hypothetical protein
MRVERRNHEAGAGNRDDQIDFVGAHSGAFETLLRGALAELNGVLHVFLIGFFERARLDCVINRKNHMALVDLSIVHDGHHGLEPPFGNLEDPAHVILHVIAGDDVRRQCGGRRRDKTRCSIAIGRSHSVQIPLGA